jgi:antibiotic biosynthesis monooxygenase (ABM) superfamily enzyme
MSMSTTDAHGTSVIVHDVHVDHREHYERWMLRAIQAHASFPGFLATDVIRPVGSGLRFIVVVRFDSEAGAQAWLASDMRDNLLVETLPWLLSEDRYHVHSGSDFWFTPPGPGPVPRRWKQWMLSTAAVFPLTVVMPWLVHSIADPMAPGIHDLLLKGVIATSISGVMVYWLMPALIRMAGRWLTK